MYETFEMADTLENLVGSSQGAVVSISVQSDCVACEYNSKFTCKH